MSGICGVFHLDESPLKANTIHEMSEIISFRGLDQIKRWSKKRVALASLLTHTTLESHYDLQPYERHFEPFAIVFDGRLDNRDELKEALGVDSSKFHQVADSELIIAAYRKWGYHSASKLVGDFAFALWDDIKQELFCVRDQMGIKPFLFCYKENQFFTFASEIKSILAHDRVPRKLNNSLFPHYLALSQTLKRHQTLFEGIEHLPPSHFMIVSKTRIKIERYWHPYINAPIRLASENEYAEAFQEHFRRSVKARLRTNLSVGSTLSGGLDSSSITAMIEQELRKEGSKKLHTFSAIFPKASKIDPHIDERNFIKIVLEGGEFHHHEVLTDNMSIFPDYEQLLFHFDEALPAPNIYINWAIYKMSKEVNVPILFTGWDGDSVISYGYEYFKELAAKGHWFSLFREMRLITNKDIDLSDKYGWDYIKRRLGRKKIQWTRTQKFIKSNFLTDILPKEISQLQRSFTHSPSHSELLASKLLNQEYLSSSRILEEIQELERVKKGNQIGLNAQETHWYSLDDGLLDSALKTLDRLSAAHGLELRHPFLDHRLVEFCVRTPAKEKLKQGWRRYLLRNGMKGILDQRVLWRQGKGRLAIQFMTIFLNKHKELLEDTLFHHSIIEEYADIERAKHIYQTVSHLKNQRDLLKYPDEIFHLFIYLAMELWAQHAQKTFFSQ